MEPIFYPLGLSPGIWVQQLEGLAEKNENEKCLKMDFYRHIISGIQLLNMLFGPLLATIWNTNFYTMTFSQSEISSNQSTDYLSAAVHRQLWRHHGHSKDDDVRREPLQCSTSRLSAKEVICWLVILILLVGKQILQFE